MVETTGVKELFKKFSNLSTKLCIVIVVLMSPGLHSRLGRQSLLLPPLQSLNVAGS